MLTSPSQSPHRPNNRLHPLRHLPARSPKQQLLQQPPLSHSGPNPRFPATRLTHTSRLSHRSRRSRRAHSSLVKPRSSSWRPHARLGHWPLLFKPHPGLPRQQRKCAFRLPNPSLDIRRRWLQDRRPVRRRVAYAIRRIRRRQNPGLESYGHVIGLQP